jgi:hypothetical protein
MRRPPSAQHFLGVGTHRQAHRYSFDHRVGHMTPATCRSFASSESIPPHEPTSMHVRCSITMISPGWAIELTVFNNRALPS